MLHVRQYNYVNKYVNIVIRALTEQVSYRLSKTNGHKPKELTAGYAAAAQMLGVYVWSDSSRCLVGSH